VKTTQPNTPLDSWILQRIGVSEDPLTLEDLRNYQLGKLRETIRYACAKSPFYSRRLSGFPVDGLADLCQVSQLPFTTAEDIRADPRQFLALPPHEIARIVTLQTSGTTGRPKRFFFTKEELEHTIDFFARGMSALVKPGQKVLILLPGDKPDSVGDLLARGLMRMNVEGIVHGPVRDIRSAAEEIVERRIDCLVGIPTQVLSLARNDAGRSVPPGMIKSVLLCTDCISEAIADALSRSWNCRVFKHYGTTEMGLGGAVECAARTGYHLREADLLFEIVDPDTGAPLKDGEPGEIVVSTLTRKGMPLIRYRTGDISRILEERCSCGSVTKRLDAIRERLDGRVTLANGTILTLSEMDEALFRVEEILDYSAAVTAKDGSDCLEITLYVEEEESSAMQKTLHALNTVPAVATALSDGSLHLAPISISNKNWFTTGVVKRRIIDNRTGAK